MASMYVGLGVLDLSRIATTLVYGSSGNRLNNSQKDKSLVTKMEELEHENAELRGIVHFQEVGLEDQRTDFRARIYQLDNEKQSAESRAITAEERATLAQNEFLQAAKERDTDKVARQYLANSAQSWQDRALSAEHLNKQFQNKLEASKRKGTELANQIEAAKDRESDLQTQLDRSNREVTNLKFSVKSNLKEIQEGIQAISSWKHATCSWRNLHSVIQESNAALTSRAEAAEEEISKLKTQLEYHQAELIDSRHKVKRLQDDTTKYQKIIADQTKEYSALENSLAAVKSQKTKMQQVIEALFTELVRAGDRVDLRMVYTSVPMLCCSSLN
ncbi:MAG: hypothetical protein Q9209_005154 [Squamulea sp. 1 TL-2023]